MDNDKLKPSLKDENQKVVDKKREAYLNNEISHSDYYLWLSDFLEIPGYLIPFRREELLLSTDPHMNDLSLSRWDGQHIFVSRYVYKKIRSWSLSETVCVLKAMARQMIK